MFEFSILDLRDHWKCVNFPKSHQILNIVENVDHLKIVEFVDEIDFLIFIICWSGEVITFDSIISHVAGTDISDFQQLQTYVDTYYGPRRIIALQTAEGEDVVEINESTTPAQILSALTTNPPVVTQLLIGQKNQISK
jgi:hypothetical protein